MSFMEHVEGLGSVWVFDDGASRYMRLPRMETPREHPEWGDARAGSCQDGVWHDMVGWCRVDGGRRLVIVPAVGEPFWAPLVPEVLGSTYDAWSGLDEVDPELYEAFFEARLAAAQARSFIAPAASPHALLAEADVAVFGWDR